MEPIQLSPERQPIAATWLQDETEAVQRLLPDAELPGPRRQRVHDRAAALVQAVRRQRHPLDAFLAEYDLSTQEGVLLMCLAEALLRIPDPATAERLIRDKLSKGRWDAHLGHSRSLLVNASAWGLLLTGRLVQWEQRLDPESPLEPLLHRGEELLRELITRAMRILGDQFILAQTLDQALGRCNAGERYSFDMLGEAALTRAAADAYLSSYRQAIAVLKQRRPGPGSEISVKLSALHPRYEYAQRQRVLAELTPRLLTLAREARAADIGLTWDAEEAERLDLMLDLFEAVFTHGDLRGWEGLGLAVQAYQKRAAPLIDYLTELAKRCGKRIPVRLVKGAYWDTEIKRAQERGLPGYPVFTRKVNTDVSYLALARRILARTEALAPRFATHNAHTVAWVLEAAGDLPFEFQRLHGMGEALYRALHDQGVSVPCRVYAPIGSHRELLPYLVRRLLENGANTSFVNRLSDERLPVETLVADPAGQLRQLETIPNPRIPLPPDWYLPQRPNAIGLNLADPLTLNRLAETVPPNWDRSWRAQPLVGGRKEAGPERQVLSPVDGRVVGTVTEADASQAQAALAHAEAAWPDWDAVPVTLKAECLEKAARLFEAHRDAFLALCLREAGKCLPDAVAEVREAVDYCYYYASEARRLFGEPLELKGPVGERNQLGLHGRGPFVCISPWNFPLAIFTGQVTAALVAGNPVVAKPAEQTPLIAALAVELLHQAGIPRNVLHLLPGGPETGIALVSDPRVRGVAFTGSTETAWDIARRLAQRRAPIAALIAETGGQNAMIVDSSALPEQVVSDVLTSAFNSAGQRCSALRVLFLQEDIADTILEMLAGALQERCVGDPARWDSDIGPLIDAAARERLLDHCARMDREARLIARLEPPDTGHGFWFGPRIYEIDTLGQLSCEVFGPVLHVLRFSGDDLDAVLDAIHATGYGLTLGIHSRIDSTVEYIAGRARIGNVYVNRNMIGAVVGVQPFGGEGLSGTGPKAGGPHYLLRFATERTLTVNTAAVGGSYELLRE
ncbi:MAG TPA: bifunctional proline dehydrogenase/L-glutamate gamma-semialdehyde dehydrogenase PutA [Sedimenticola sp.]|nr:bifunctional proline dehydrogenase/L-glutamate gamma-semialdehyde dehydrogenase PutA [Sedimenticola sp.]